MPDFAPDEQVQALSSAPHVIAVDLGADSGRVMRVSLDDAGLHLHEVSRFTNTPVRAANTLHWDVLRLWHEISQGVDAAKQNALSVGVDAWGVDFALLSRDGRLLGNPVHYRDDRTLGAQEWVFARVPKREVFERSGLQFLNLNTLYQLASMVRDENALLDVAGSYLSVPDLFHYWLSGEKACEFTHSSTTQFYNPHVHAWDVDMLARLGVPTRLFADTPIVSPGTRLGEYNGIPVITPATHDTGSAVVGIPTLPATKDDDFAYISSGTWSLIGLELDTPLITDETFAANLTNEGGVGGKWRFIKNVAGMWLVQQSRYSWRAAGREYSYDQLAAMAEQAEAFTAFVDPDDPLFYTPGDMPSRIREACAQSGQRVPESDGAILRVIYESLALKYRFVLETMIRLTGRPVTRLHIIGGGANNALLNQMTANAFQHPVIAGPSEATALGNAMVQFIALGRLADVAEGRALLRRTVPLTTFEPRDVPAWDEAYGRFLQIMKVPA